MPSTYDAILIVSFGGPEGMQDVMPFLENVTRGRNVPRERLMEVAHHYEAFAGVSPHNQQIQELIEALRPHLAAQGIRLPIYWGNRNWHPMLTNTMQQMTADGIKRAIAFVTSAYSSYSSCRQYLEDIRLARDAAGPAAPCVDKIRVFYNHPGFIEAMQDRVRQALDQVEPSRREAVSLLYTAHSLPRAMAENCWYEAQLREAARLVCEAFPGHAWSLVYQSRSGPPSVPWLEPDVCDQLRQLRQAGHSDVVVVPIGFVSDHLEVVYDLDTEAKQLCDQLGLNMVRAKTAGTHERFVAMMVGLIQERINDEADRSAIGHHGPSHDVCPEDCCLPPARPRVPAGSSVAGHHVVGPSGQG